MAQPVIVAANTTGSPIDLDQLDVTVAADPGTADLTVDNTTSEVLNDEDLLAEVEAGNLTLTIDTVDLTSEQSKVFLKYRNFQDGALNNTTATTNPGTGDDEDDGYAVGSVWTNVTLDTAFICVDASSGAAVWISIDASGAVGIGYNDENNILANQVFS